ncbi:MAG: hypothetical protein HQL25_06635 [Candidatus Omnitrophica bacterium]|nr:hypothetical protein [Candidatus Omnitrophota bacterium]
MLRATFKFKSVLVVILGVSLLCSCAFAREDDNRGDRKEDNRGDVRGDVRRDNSGDNRGDIRENRHEDRWSHNRQDRYHYRDGRWFRRGWFGWEFVVSTLVIGALVESLPPNHTTIIIDNTPYYYDNVVYYRQLPDGAYIVVQPPRR